MSDLSYIKSSSAAVLATSSDWLGPCGSVQVSTLSSRIDPHGPNWSEEARSTAAADDLIELKLAQIHMALTNPKRTDPCGPN